MIIPRDKYTFIPSTNSIQLLDPYNTITTERILSIRNLTKQIDIYNSENPRNHQAVRDDGMDITVANSVISYVESAPMSNTDILKIIIDTAVVTSTGGGGGGVTTITVDPINFYSNQSIPASGSVDTTGLNVVNCTKLNIYFSNTGASTNVDITVKGSPTSTLTLSKIIGDPIKLGAGGSSGPVIGEDEIPGYVWFSMKNNDTVNAATISITIDRYVGSYIQTNTVLLSGVSIAASGSSTSDPVYTSAARRVNVYCDQTGTSTNTTFDVYGKSSLSPNIPKLLATCTLGTNEKWGCGILKDVIPGSIYTKVSNFDTVNPTVATVLVESFT